MIKISGITKQINYWEKYELKLSFIYIMKKNYLCFKFNIIIV